MTFVHQDFDIIVVGAGTAGCVLAARISENPDIRVLLVEAGPMDRNPWIHIPVGFSRLLHNRQINWCYETVSQTLLNGRKIFWPRGKVVGGSAAINGMIWVRGTPGDYDAWAQETGDPDWSWNSVQDWFKICEFAPTDADDRLGRVGKVTMTWPRPTSELAQAFIGAGMELGLKVRKDLAISDENCVGEYLTTVGKGLRISPANTYLKPALKRKNLTLMTDTLVLSVSLDDTYTATGITVREHGQERFIQAKRGVVLSGGTVNTPQLLMLSGIGKGKQLAEHGIPTRINLAAVGKNLQDHYGARLVARLNKPVTINDDFRRPWRMAGHAINFVLRRQGPMTIGGAHAGAFLSTKLANGSPDIQVHFLPLSINGPGWSFHSFSGITANVCQLRPHSRGTVTLRSPDPDTAPAIDPNYLSDPRDQQVLAEGLRITRTFFETPPFSTRYSAREEYPGNSKSDDAELVDYARANGSTVFHPVGTCRMGQGADSVVDKDFHVHGTHNLWVADASVMPLIPSGNTNAATMMLAERASAKIRGALNQR